MRIGGLALLLLGAAWAAGCGQDDNPAPVALAISTPADSAVVHEDAVEVRGRVKPAGATVIVLGQQAAVAQGKFSASVPLREGPNVIDVGASAPGATSAWRAVRVARQSLVRLPDLAGENREDAVDRLAALGLHAEVDEDDGLLDELLPGGRGVCEMDPDAGAKVPRGARVRIRVSKTC
jgi:hypothetical protein